MSPLVQQGLQVVQVHTRGGQRLQASTAPQAEAGPGYSDARQIDLQAREQISLEFGHYRIEGMSA